MVGFRLERRGLIQILGCCGTLVSVVVMGCAAPTQPIGLTEISSAEVGAVPGAFRTFSWQENVYAFSVDPVSAVLRLFRSDKASSALLEAGTIQAAQFSSSKVCGMEIGWLHESVACFMVADCNGESQLYSFHLERGFQFEWQGTLSLTGGSSSFPGVFVVGSGRQLMLFSLKDKPKRINTPDTVISTAALDSGFICALLQDGNICIYDQVGNEVFQLSQPFWQKRRGLSALGSHLLFVADSLFRRNELVGVINPSTEGGFECSYLGTLPEGAWVISRAGGFLTFHDGNKLQAPMIAWPSFEPSCFRTLSLSKGGSFLPSDSTNDLLGYIEENQVRFFEIAGS